MEKEIWKEIKGYEGQYEVSNLGQVKSYMVDDLDGRIHKPKVNKQGYVCHMFYDGKQYTLHSLVLNAFVGNPNGYKQIDHINNNKEDNRLENLQWIVAKENVRKEQADTILCEHLDGNRLLAKGTRHAAELTGVGRTPVKYSIKNGNYTRSGWKFTRIEKAIV